MLCRIGLVFSWHKRNGGGGWNAATFCLAGLAGSGPPECSLRNEDGAVPEVGLPKAKSVTGKTNIRVGRGRQQKRPRSLEERKAGIFCCLRVTCWSCPLLTTGESLAKLLCCSNAIFTYWAKDEIRLS